LLRDIAAKFQCRRIKKAIAVTHFKGFRPKYKRLYSRTARFQNATVKVSRIFLVLADSDIPLEKILEGGRWHVRKTSMVKGDPEDLGVPELPDYGNGDLIDDVEQLGIPECMTLAGAASIGRVNLRKLMWFDGKEKVTVRVYADNDGVTVPIYMAMRKRDIYHEKSSHHAWWPFALSGAMAKIGDDGIRGLREREGGTFNSEGLRIFTPQDCRTQTGDQVSLLLTGRVLNPNQTRLLIGSDVSKRERANSIQGLWENIDGASDCRRWRECRCGVMCLQSPVGVHALLWQKHDLRTNCASLVDPRAGSEIANEYALGRWRYKARTLEMCSFGTVTRALFLPIDAPTREFYVDSGDDL
jgi:hypothetical protein